MSMQKQNAPVSADKIFETGGKKPLCEGVENLFVDVL